MTNPENGHQWTDFVDLKVEEWGSEPVKVAYTFNSDSENTAKQLFKALEKYRELKFVTGVSGGTKNYLIQNSVSRHMERLYGDKVTIEVHNERFDSNVYRLK